jgi:hypothetical protein
MNMQRKYEIFMMVFLVGGILGFIFFATLFGNSLLAIFVFGWFSVFAVSQSYILKCPNCHTSCCQKKWLGGIVYGVAPKGNCRNCGTPY